MRIKLPETVFSLLNYVTALRINNETKQLINTHRWGLQDYFYFKRIGPLIPAPVSLSLTIHMPNDRYKSVNPFIFSKTLIDVLQGRLYRNDKDVFHLEVHIDDTTENELYVDIEGSPFVPKSHRLDGLNVLPLSHTVNKLYKVSGGEHPHIYRDRTVSYGKIDLPFSDTIYFLFPDTARPDIDSVPYVFCGDWKNYNLRHVYATKDSQVPQHTFCYGLNNPC